MTHFTANQAQPSGPQVIRIANTGSTSRMQVITPTSVYQIQQEGPSNNSILCDSSNQTIASLKIKKSRSLTNIYQQEEEESSEGWNSLFSLYSLTNDPIHFEDAVKDEK